MEIAVSIDRQGPLAVQQELNLNSKSAMVCSSYFRPSTNFFPPGLSNLSDGEKHIVLSADRAGKVVDSSRQRDLILAQIVQHL